MQAEMSVLMWEIDRVKPYPGNPRNNEDAVDAVANSLKTFGWRQPLVVDAAGVLVVGHTRLKAAAKLGWKKVPVHVATDLTPEQVKAYRLADNASGEIATWNYDLLPIELAGLKDADFDLGLLGFDSEELQRLMSGDVKEGLVDPDDVPAPPDAAVTQPGDLWILGDHRLLCGDSSKPEDLDRLLDGATIHLCNTDPPYNVKVEPRSNNAIAAGLSSFQATHHQSMDVARHPEKAKPTQKKLRAKDRPLANDFVTDEQFDALLDAWFGNVARVLEPGRAFYCWGGYANLGNYPPFLKKHGLYFSQGIVWDKQHPVLTRKDFMGAFEICFYGWREGAAHRFYGPNNATDLWHVKKVTPQSMVHLTEKPTELAVRAIQYDPPVHRRLLRIPLNAATAVGRFYGRHAIAILSGMRFAVGAVVASAVLYVKWRLDLPRAHWFSRNASYVALAAYFAVIFAFVPLLRRKREVQSRRAGGLCPACGYGLRATPERCPECGTIYGYRLASPLGQH